MIVNIFPSFTTTSYNSNEIFYTITVTICDLVSYDENITSVISTHS